jgi:dolichyl-phosphate beta-glucosyltransferase
MKLSIVIPAFNESGKIAADVESACQFLQKNAIDGEVIVVDDGSTDGTDQAAQQAGLKHAGNVKVRVLRIETCRGKGYAVASGIRISNGQYVMFADSGNCVPYDNTLRGLDLLSAGQCEIAHGSRNLAETQIQRDHGLYRHICSELFHIFAKTVMRIPAELTDTQCGFKIYRGDVGRKLYSQGITEGFMFDIEVILLAIKQGYRIKEFPVDWICDLDSRLTPARSLWRTFVELIKIKKQLRARK